MSGKDVAQPEAALAIQLRLMVRAAIDRDDMPEVRRLNHIADEAYLKLSPAGARVYLGWCRDEMQPFLLSPGDA